MRALFLQIVGVAAVQGCTDRPVVDSTGEMSGGTSTSTSGEAVTTTTDPDPGGVTSTETGSGATGTGSGDTGSSGGVTAVTTTGVEVTTSGDGTSSSGDEASGTSTGTGTSTGSAEVSTGGTTSDPNDEPCYGSVFDESLVEGVLCLPKGVDACGECDDTCYFSPEADAKAEELSGCGDSELRPKSGPSEQDGQCCYMVVAGCCIIPGRPLVVDGRAQVATAAARDAWQAELGWRPPVLPAAVREDAAARWTRAALAEHASIAAFARFGLQLMALGAPPELVLETQAALVDEVEHARVSFAVAAALAGRPVGAGALPAAVGELSRGRAAFVVETFREGCVGESIAAAVVGLAAARCGDPVLRAILERIAEDELRHAALAWRAVRWALAQADGDELRAALAAVEPGVAVDEGLAEVGALGLLSSREEAAVAAALWREVIAPCRDALLAGHGPGDMLAEARA